MNKLLIISPFLLLSLFNSVWATDWCSSNPDPYDCKIADSCACYIHPQLPGMSDVGAWSMKFSPLEKKKYECTFKLSPLPLFINIEGSYFPEGVKYTLPSGDRGNEIKMNVDATDANLNAANSFIQIKFNFGAYDSFSTLSGACVEK